MLGKLLRERAVDAVRHGFRSSVHDGAADKTDTREFVEAALAHTMRWMRKAAGRS